MHAVTLQQPKASLAADGTITVLPMRRRAPSTIIGQPLALRSSSRQGGWNTGPINDAVGALNRKLGLAFENWPRGMIVGTAIVVDCVPILYHQDWGGRDAVLLEVPYVTGIQLSTNDGTIDITGQTNPSEFIAGHWALLLKDAKPTTERCPECMGEGQFYEDSMIVIGVPGGRYPVAPCDTCQQTGICSSIPAKGGNGFWEWTPDVPSPDEPRQAR